MTTTEPDSPCDLRCGYVSSGQDLIDHMLYEHKRCPDCGSAPIAAYDSVTHEPWCPRLQPGYAYPSADSEEG